MRIVIRGLPSSDQVLSWRSDPILSHALRSMLAKEPTHAAKQSSTIAKPRLMSSRPYVRTQVSWLA
jgi:hypothetical protein